MIYTVTFNPSLDYIVDVHNFRLGMTNRTVGEQLVPGGKGINVSMMLHNLGVKSVALGFRAGFVGDEIQRRLNMLGIENDLICLSGGNSRINVKLRSVEGTEINGLGPDIDEAGLKGLLKRLDRLKAGDVLVLAGSIPAGIPDSIYKDITASLADKGVFIVVDAAGALLANVLPNHPFLIKPNHHELGEIFGAAFHRREEVLPYGKELQKMGVKNVIVSMGGEGAVFFAENGSIYMAQAPKGQLVNSVGAGDSMVAGFLEGWLSLRDYGHAFQMGVAAGSASAFSEGLAAKEKVMAVYDRLTVKKV